jgi:predicted RNase H-like HicB family nuclease
VVDPTFIRIVVHAADEGGFWADTPDIDGVVTVGDTLDDIRRRSAEAVAAWRDEPVGDVTLLFDYPITNK